jgi:peroxiredoxin/outer membrane lipoprotein-sorting protein
MRKAILPLLFFTTVLYHAAAQDPKDVLAHVKQVYSNLHAVHIAATVNQEMLAAGRYAASSSDYELAEKAGGKYTLRSKQGDEESVLVSNGAKTWKALPKAKKWSQIDASGMPDSDNEEDEQPPAERPDFHKNIRDLLVGRFLVLAGKGESPEFVKQGRYKLGKDKVDCYVLRVTYKNVPHELWIDAVRGLVLQDTEVHPQQMGRAIGQVTSTTKVKTIEIENEVADSVFEFAPEPSWKEVEMLVLPGETRTDLTGQKAADFSIKSLDGEKVELAALRGKVVVLDFWATWCPPCRAELPTIDKLRAEFGDKVQFFGVNDEDSGIVKGFVKKHNYEMGVLMDSSRAVHRQYGVHAIPTVLIIDRTGVIRSHFIGGRNEQALRDAIQKAMLTEPRL